MGSLKMSLDERYNFSEIEQLIINRRSARLFKKDDVPDQTIEKLINLARWAPSGMNAQPWKFVVIKDKKLIQEVREATVKGMKFTLKVFTGRGLHWRILKLIWRVLQPSQFKTIDPRVLQGMKAHTKEKGSDVFHNAPVLILILGHSGSSTWLEDCSAATQNLALAAHAMGLGACWIGFTEKFLPLFGSKSLKKKLHIEGDWVLATACVLGYPAVNYDAPVERERPEIIWFK
jgi:nitroreductase